MRVAITTCRAPVVEMIGKLTITAHHQIWLKTRTGRLLWPPALRLPRIGDFGTENVRSGEW